MKLLSAFLPLLLVLTGSSAAADDSDVSPAGRFTFTEVTGPAGIMTSGDEGGHGVAFADVNGDGYLDIYINNTDYPPQRPNFLFIYQGRGKFKNEAIARGVDGNDPGSHGVIFADIDNDGDFDLIVANAGGGGAPGQNRVYENDGSGYFKDITKKAGLLGQTFITRGIAAGDFNGDGRVDIAVTNPVPNWDIPGGLLQINRLYINRGKNRFLRTYNGLSYSGFAQGLTTADIDSDGDLDLAEAKWSVRSADGTSNSLWLNNGKGAFADFGDQAGDTFHYDDTNSCNGIAFGDTDNDGDLDMIVLGDSLLRFYVNEGEGVFVEQTEASGLSGKGYTAAFGDVNHDGRQDVIVAYSNISETFVVFQNLGNNSFRRLGNVGATPPNYNDPRGMALGDYDNDGDLDIVVVHKKGTPQLFRNGVNNSNFLKLRLTSPSGEAGAIGAQVWVYPAGKLGEEDSLLAYRQIGGSTGYISQNAPEIHVGLIKKKARVDVLVKFLDGTTASFTGVLPGRTITVGFK